MYKNKKEILVCILLSGIAVAFLFTPIYSVFLQGVFKWHLSQAAFWKDVIELFVYFSSIIILSVIFKNRKGIIVLIAGIVYLMSTGVLLQCVVSYIYIEIIIYIGHSFLTFAGEGKKTFSVGSYFLSGSIIWGMFAIIMSFMKIGSINELRLLTVVLLLAAVVNPKNQTCWREFLIVRYVHFLNENSLTEFSIHLFYVIVMFISCARVNTHIDYDSRWYALYTDKCLFGENSFYDFLGYTEFVFYYPKFKELLMAPITGLGMPGYLISSNLCIMVLCLIEVYLFLAENIKQNKNYILCIVYLIFSTVCIIGISGTAKSDTLSYFYMIVLILYFIKYLKTKEQASFYLAISSGIMSYTVKYTSFLFSTIIFFIVFIVIVCMLLQHKIDFVKPKWIYMILGLAALFIFLGILYRTWILTGYPTYRNAKNIWDALGFQAKMYFDVDADYKLQDVFLLSRIYSILFDVNNAEKITAQWMGNYSVFFLLCSLCLFRRKKGHPCKILCSVTGIFSAVSLYCLVTMAAPDGNYFSVPIIIATCYIFIRITQSTLWKYYKNWFAGIVCMFLILNLAFVFVTHPSWGTATRFSDTPISLCVSEEEKYETKWKNMEIAGISEINERLKESGGSDFILTDGDISLNGLDARVQRAQGLFDRYYSGANINSYQDFIQYVNYVPVNGFIVDKEENNAEVFQDYVRQYITEYGFTDQIDNEKYSYYRIK